MIREEKADEKVRFRSRGRRVDALESNEAKKAEAAKGRCQWLIIGWAKRHDTLLAQVRSARIARKLEHGKRVAIEASRPSVKPRRHNKSGPSVGNWVHSLRSIRYCLPRIRLSVHSLTVATFTQLCVSIPWGIGVIALGSPQILLRLMESIELDQRYDNYIYLSILYNLN